MTQLPHSFPLSLTDDLFFHLDQPASPFSIQMEVRIQGPLDEDRVREALGKAAERHPMMRVNMAPYQSSDTTFYWQLPTKLESIPLRVVDCVSEETLNNARTELHSLSVPLAESPPFRAVLAHCENGDMLMLNVSHTVCDGIGLYRFLMSVLRAYANIDDPIPEIPFLEARDMNRQVGSRSTGERLNRIKTLFEVLGTSIVPPTRIAADGAEDHAGLAFVPLRFTQAQTSRLEHLRNDGATINDILLTALHQGIDRWNTAHGKSSGRTSIMMPLNTRPAERQYELASNLSVWINILAHSDDRSDFDRLLKVITEQTARVKERNNAGLLIDLLYEIRNLPAWAKKAMPGLLPLTGNRIVDTTVLNNLGRVPPALPEDAELQVRELWFSPPCRLPMGVSVGAVTLQNRLHLSFRYHRQHFSRDSAWSFAETFLDVLEEQAKG